MAKAQLKVAITGCATGIGAETARVLKARGAYVTGFDVAEPKANVDRYVPIDLADAASIAGAVASVDGPFDALCNIAGLPPKTGNGTAPRILAVNIVGLRRFTRAMLPKLGPGASIVNMASRAGQRWRENLAQVKALLAAGDDVDLAALCARERIDDVRAYDLSKEALIVWTMAVTEALLARGVRMSTISPGAVETRIMPDFIAAFGERATKQIARAGRAGTAAEVAEVAAFLASPEGGWIKGVDIVVDGGKSAFAASDALALGGIAL